MSFSGEGKRVDFFHDGKSRMLLHHRLLFWQIQFVGAKAKRASEAQFSQTLQSRKRESEGGRWSSGQSAMT